MNNIEKEITNIFKVEYESVKQATLLMENLLKNFKESKITQHFEEVLGSIKNEQIPTLVKFQEVTKIHSEGLNKLSEALINASNTIKSISDDILKRENENREQRVASFKYLFDNMSIK